MKYGDGQTHGNRSYYVNAGCRCDDCRAANARYHLERQRRRGVKPMKRAEHGTWHMYNHHRCRCPACREANRRWQRVFRARRVVRGRAKLSLIPHGRGGYNNWGCRCDVCRAANSEACREWRERKSV